MSLPIRLIDLTQKPTEIGPVEVNSGGDRPTVIPDLRRVTVQEFLRSSNLAPSSRKAYERELRRFLGWTELTWGELKLRHLAQYKQFLQELETGRSAKQRLARLLENILPVELRRPVS